jgi:gliding motility-associated-like protein
VRKSFLHLKIIIIFCISIVSVEMHAQLGLCNGNSGDPIFTEDFGVGTTNTALAPGTTTYTFSNGIPDDGEYTVNNGTFGNGIDWHQIEDHTPGDVNGKCLIIQAGPSAGEFYRTTTSTNLCENTTYEFSAWIINLVIANSFCSSQPGGTIPINVRFEIWDSTDSILLAGGDTGNIVESNTPNWQEYGLVFQTLPAQTSVILKMINNGAGGCGNDLAIDDIEFKTCGDLIAVEDTSNNDSVTLCSSQTTYSDTITALPDGSVFTMGYFYQWQISTDGIIWIDVSGETNASIAVSGITTTTYYRTKVAEFAANLGNSDCITFSDVYQIRVNPSPNLPISLGDVNFNCTTNQAILSVAALSGISINWYDAAAGGTLLQSNSETYTATAPGVYYAEAVNTSNSCVSSARVAVNAIAIAFPATPISNGDVSLDCNTNQATLSVTVPAGIVVDWFDAANAGNLLASNSTSLVVNAIGTYYAEARDATTGCVSGTRVSVTASISAQDDASFAVTATCDGATVNIVGTTGGIFEFNPVPTDGAIIDASTGNVVNATSGASYTIEYNTLGVCSATSTETFTVLPDEDASFTIASTCDGGIVTITGDLGGTFIFNPLPTDGAIINPLTGDINNVTQGETYFVEYTITAGACPSSRLQSFTFNSEIILFNPTPLELCDALGESPGDEITVFDLTVKDTEITGGNTSWLVAYYETDADAQAQISAIPDPTQYTNTSVNGLAQNPQTLYVVVTDTVTGCVAFTTMVIRVLPNPTPTPSPQLPDLELCDVVNTGDGEEVFNLLGLEGANAQEDLILAGDLQATLTYYETAEDADSGTDMIPDPSNYENTQSPEQTIYVRMTSNATGCYAVVNFTIRVNPLPTVIAVTDFIQCELNTDGIDSFDLTTKDDDVLNGQNPTQFIVSYHLSLADAASQTDALVSPYTNITNPQQIFVAITNTLTGCFISTQRFNIRVDEGAEANPDMVAILYEQCDDATETDGDPSNDSVQFDLATRDLDVLGGQDPTNYIVSYYATEDNANLNVSPLPTLYENLTNPQVIYARVDNETPDPITGNDSSICFAVSELTLQVNPLPEFDLEDRYVLCINTNGTEVLSTPLLDTELSATDYSFEWRYNGTLLVSETGPSIGATQVGTYSVIVTDISTSSQTRCTNTDTAEVVGSEPPMLTAEVITQLFGDSNVIEAVATGIGDYEYSLDGDPWQDSGVFTDVSPGLRLITARDKNGCGIVTIELAVIDYPLYFTPNGDGTNDTWNIEGIGSDAIIYIFDRYGKLLKQLSPTGQGWNGTFNGSVMPTSDYWFTVVYTEPQTGNSKEFKAHFTLKR